MDVRKKIKMLLAEKEVKQRELSERIGISQPAVSRILNDKQEITLDFLIKIANAFDVSLSYFDEPQKEYKEEESNTNVVKEPENIYKYTSLIDTRLLELELKNMRRDIEFLKLKMEKI